MATKDWKKINRIYPYWINNKTDDRISIIKTLQIREKYYVQYGKDLTGIEHLIGTGGIFIHHPDAGGIFLRG